MTKFEQRLIQLGYIRYIVDTKSMTYKIPLNIKLLHGNDKHDVENNRNCTVYRQMVDIDWTPLPKIIRKATQDKYILKQHQADITIRYIFPSFFVAK